MNQERLSLSLSMTLFLLCGFSTVLNVILIPYLQSALSLHYTPVALVQVSFYLAYFLFSPLSGYLFQSRSYLEGIKAGLFIGSLGTLTLYWASVSLSFSLILLGVFILGAGIATLQVTGNPYTLITGNPETAPSRLTLAQAFTSLGTILAPYFGAVFILSLSGTHHLYLILTIMWMATLLYTACVPLPDGKEPKEKDPGNPLYEPFVWLGALAIACSTGMEVTISTYVTKFTSEMTDLSLVSSGKLMMIFWSGFFLGRLLGSSLLACYSASTLIYGSVLSGAFLTLVCILFSGYIAVTAILLTGFSLSILFPIIFSQTLEYCQSPKGAVSGFLCMANIGGAVFPLVQGYLADTYTLHFSFVLPLFGFFYLTYFAYDLQLRASSRPCRINL